MLPTELEIKHKCYLKFLLSFLRLYKAEAVESLMMYDSEKLIKKELYQPYIKNLNKVNMSKSRKMSVKMISENIPFPIRTVTKI